MHDGRAGGISAEQKEYLGDILTSSKHLLQIINDVLDLAKVEAGRITLRPSEVNLAHLIGEVVDGLLPLAASKAMRIGIEVAPDFPTVHIDPDRMKQVLYNYLSNAIKFTDDGGTVVVRAFPIAAARFTVEVQDSGIGIATEDLSALFTEFHQLDGSFGKRYQGTGLGLALTRRIVEAQGGEVGVRSVSGEGSVFHATLPTRFGDETGTQEPHHAR